jgi:hypothetical protein
MEISRSSSKPWATEKRAEYVVWALGDNDKQWPFYYEIYEHVGAGKKPIVSA